MASVAEQVRNKNSEFLQLLQHHDAAGIAGMYSHEARLMAPGSEMLVGSDKIQAFWENVLRTGITDVKLETIDVDTVGGYTAVETGKFTMYAGKSVADRGKYIVIWRNEDGLWKLHRDIWNSDAARPATISA